MLDDMKGTVESCGPVGEDHQILLHYQKTEPVDVEWYGGSPLWTDDSSYRGIGFTAKRGGPSTGITSLYQFQKASGIHVYYGEYPRIIHFWNSRGTVVHQLDSLKLLKYKESKTSRFINEYESVNLV